MIKLTKAVQVKTTYVNYYNIDESVIIDKFGSIDRFEEICDGEEPSDDESDAMYELQELLEDSNPSETFEVSGDYDETSIHSGHIDPDSRLFTK